MEWHHWSWEYLLGYNLKVAAMPGRGHNHSENVTPEQSILPAPDHHDPELAIGTEPTHQIFKV